MTRQIGNKPEFGNAPECPKGFVPDHKLEAANEEKRYYRKLWHAERDRAYALAAHVERLNWKLGDIKDSLYGQNLHIVGWHLNGATEPVDNWFEDNDWEPEPHSDNSLARRDAEKQAEGVALAKVAFNNNMHADFASRNWIYDLLDGLEDELSRQAEEIKP